MQAPAPVHGVAHAGQQGGVEVVVEGDAHHAGCLAGVAGGGRELRQRAVEGHAVARSRRLGEGAQPHQEGDRLVEREAQRPGDGVGVADEDLAALPLGLDQVAREPAGQTAEEQQLEVGDQLVLGETEVLGRLLDGHALALDQVRDHRQQP